MERTREKQNETKGMKRRDGEGEINEKRKSSFFQPNLFPNDVCCACDKRVTNVGKQFECELFARNTMVNERRDASHDPVKLPSQFRDTSRTTACINASRHRDALSEIIYSAKL